MKQGINIRVIKENKSILFNKREYLDLSDTNNVQDLINTLKSKLVELPILEIQKEELYFGTQLMKPEEFVPDETAIKLILTIK